MARLERDEIRQRIDDATNMYNSGYERVAEFYGQWFTNYAWPGGYTVIFMNDMGDVLCADCAKRDFITNGTDITAGTYDEGPTMYCDECNAEIESSYGEVE